MLRIWFIANVLLWQINIEIFGSKLGLNVALLVILGAAWIWKRQGIAAYSAKVIFAFAVLLVVSYMAAIAGPCTDKLQKLLFTAPIFLFLTLVGLEVGWSATEDDWIKLQNIAVWALLLAFAGLLIEILLPEAFPARELNRDAGKFSGFYSEPSFVAYSLFPCVLILLEAQSKQVRRNGLIALCGLLLLSRSSTLLVLIVVWVLYRLSKKRDLGHSIGLIFAGLLVVGLAAILNYDLLVAPTVERLAGVVVEDSVANLSSLAYLQGWQDAWDNLIRTNGLGLGFNMMGCSPLPDVPARVTIADVFGMQSNDEDGTFLFSKLVSETGVVGLLLFMAITLWWLKMELESSGSGPQSPAYSIQLALIMSFVATSLVRSPGYFSGSVFLLLVAIAATRRQGNR